MSIPDLKKELINIISTGLPKADVIGIAVIHTNNSKAKIEQVLSDMVDEQIIIEDDLFYEVRVRKEHAL